MKLLILEYSQPPSQVQVFSPPLQAVHIINKLATRLELIVSPAPYDKAKLSWSQLH
jgi:hypothetical protein